MSAPVTADELAWKEYGACSGLTDLFYPDDNGDVRNAQAVCKECVVQEECLEYALVHDEKYGVWGGFSERGRRRLRRERRQLRLVG
jgi:WhiB family redox-sensing transcriptional regulator